MTCYIWHCYMFLSCFNMLKKIADSSHPVAYMLITPSLSSHGFKGMFEIRSLPYTAGIKVWVHQLRSSEIKWLLSSCCCSFPAQVHYWELFCCFWFCICFLLDSNLRKRERATGTQTTATVGEPADPWPHKTLWHLFWGENLTWNKFK